MRRPRIAASLHARWLRLPPRTIRLRLTLVYGALFLGSGAALLTVTYLLVARQYTDRFFIAKATVPLSPLIAPGPGLSGNVLGQRLARVGNVQSSAALHQLLIQSVIALALMTVVSIWLGWVVAGRALRPLRTITDAAREISASNLHRRLALEGPDDELRQLGSTFDGLLGRLEAAFDAQRQFVANASHELRTPLTYERTLIEVALADPNADVESLRRACEQVLAAGEQQERLIESLLTLSRSQRGLDRSEPVDLDAVAHDVLESVPHDGLTVESDLEPARTSGDARLVERLVANLVSNAALYNVPGGRIDVSTATRNGHAVLTVANTGRAISPDELDRLYQPFDRLEGGRATEPHGSGLGLSVVRAIALAHSASVTTRAQSEGGLSIEISFPSA